MIIINEVIYAENLLNNGFSLPYNKRFKDIFILSKYYKHLGLSQEQIQSKLYEFLNKFDKEFDINTNNKDREIVSKIAYSVSKKNFTLRVNNNINICECEYNLIKTLKGKQIQKLALVFCILGKLYNQNTIRVQYSDLMELSNIQSLTRLNVIIKQFEKYECIEEQEFGKFDLLFLSKSICNYEVKDFICCERCGVLILNYNNKKYCNICKVDKQKEWEKESKRKKRIMASS